MEHSFRHITILCSRLDLPAGIERAIVNTANLFASKGLVVTLLILDETDNVFFSLKEEVRVNSINLHFGITEKGNTLTRKIAFAKHLWKLKRKIKEIDPDLIITTEYHFTIATALVVKNIPIFSWEHHHFHHLKKNRFWNLLFKKVYPSIGGVVCLNREEAIFFEAIGCRTYVIPNFIDFWISETKPLIHKQILTAGWLTKTKGSDLIPAIAEKFFAKYPDWSWKIIGRGDEANKLKSCRHLKLSDPVSHVEEEYLTSSIYVLPSRFECFPMVLLEAMSFGVPCVAFDCPTGPRHIIKNGEDGILVEKEDTEAMANAIIDLIENEDKRKQLGANAFENIQRFSPEKVYKLWEQLFNAQ